MIFPTAEHLYQALKGKHDYYLEWFTDPNMSPAEAKKLGREIKKRPDWNTVKLSIMREVVLLKFRQNEDLAYQLVCTGTEELVEGNWWGDRFWGVDEYGENHLGKILMDVRSLLRVNQSNNEF